MAHVPTYIELTKPILVDTRVPSLFLVPKPSA